MIKWEGQAPQGAPLLVDGDNSFAFASARNVFRNVPCMTKAPENHFD